MDDTLPASQLIKRQTAFESSHVEAFFRKKTVSQLFNIRMLFKLLRLNIFIAHLFVFRHLIGPFYRNLETILILIINK